MFVYDKTSSVLVRVIGSSIRYASRGKTRVLSCCKKTTLCLSIMERPMLLFGQFGQAFCMLLEAKQESHYVVSLFKLNKDIVT